MDYEAIKALVRDDLRAVDREIETRLQSDVALINQMGSYIVHSGGKRLRPVLVLLGSRAFGYSGIAHIRLAAIIEFIHTATLLHDDVVDASELRRGHTTANTIWGNEASVLVGDFLYSRAFEMMVEVGSLRVMEILAHTTNTIAKGEVMQLLNCHDPETTEERYIEVIRNKTAKLFQAAAQTLLQLAADPKWLGAQPGVTAILHTWGQNLLFHPHLHCVITAGGPGAAGAGPGCGFGRDRDGPGRRPDGGDGRQRLHLLRDAAAAAVGGNGKRRRDRVDGAGRRPRRDEPHPRAHRLAIASLDPLPARHAAGPAPRSAGAPGPRRRVRRAAKIPPPHVGHRRRLKSRTRQPALTYI